MNAPEVNIPDSKTLVMGYNLGILSHTTPSHVRLANCCPLECEIRYPREVIYVQIYNYNFPST